MAGAFLAVALDFDFWDEDDFIFGYDFCVAAFLDWAEELILEEPSRAEEWLVFVNSASLSSCK